MIFLFFFYGSALASFSQLVYERVLNHDTVLGHSRCNVCGTKLELVHVFPLIGYIINRGKCPYCGSKIPKIYPIMEMFGGVLLAILYLIFGLQLNLVIIMIAAIVLFIESALDIKTMIVNDTVWIIGLIPLIIINMINKTFLVSLISSLTMFLGLLFLSWITEKILKKETLGGGDIKLYLFIGMVLDLRLALLSLFLASVFGLIYAMIKKSKSDTYLPLVPFISLGVFVSYFWGNDLINWYLSLLGI